ncbi:fatty acyl-CoA hydrolase precursor, medium chain-like isoform X2 [Ranitomeya variabilis]|uniref:fatty acyl-CoA hydrolase precursor, medium chain-like isoform X2 n=1 Tax=Ranitomeya variabilis TaxID=490064 RepID=UPI004056EAD4
MESLRHILLLTPLFLTAIGTGLKDGRPLVTIKYGDLQGITVPVKETSRAIDAFFGVPFAKPPVGPLRFGNPEPPEPWKSVRDASEFPPMCLQVEEAMSSFGQYYQTSFKPPRYSEDCLYLNVFTPADRAKKSNLPVMVVIHGGGLLFGLAGLFDGSALSAYENVVVVLSPLSKGLFHRAISESGTAAMASMVVSTSEDVSYFRNIISELSGCDLASIADCLMKKSEEEIYTISKKMGMLFLPGCVDGVFLPKPAMTMFANKESNKVPFLLGMNNHEFGWLTLLFLNITEVAAGMTRESVAVILHNALLLGQRPEAIPHVVDEYVGDATDPEEIRDRFQDLCGDLMFVIPALKTAKSHRDMGVPVYFYEYQHPPSLLDHMRPDFVKADHTDELIFVSGGPFLRDGTIYFGPATQEEKSLARTIMKYWANFARTGNPNSPGLTTWPEYGADELYLEINLKQKSSSKLKEEKFKFWTEILQKKILSKTLDGGDRTEL